MSSQLESVSGAMATKSKTKHVWEIQDFKLLAGKLDWCLTSSLFSSGSGVDTRKFAWCLKLVNQTNDDNNCSLYLQMLSDTMDKLNLRRVSVALQSGEFSKKTKCEIDQPTFKEKGLLNLWNVDLNNKSFGEGLKIVVKFSYSEGISETHQSKDNKEKKKQAEDIKQSSSANSQAVPENFEALLNDTSSADVTLRFQIDGEYKDFKCHKHVLAAASPKFILELNSQENDENVIEIMSGDYYYYHITSEVADEMMKYIYTGKISIPDDPWMERDLLVAANRYEMDKLKALVEEHLVKNLTNENACDLFEDCEMSEKNKNRVVQFILDNLEYCLYHCGSNKEEAGFMRGFVDHLIKTGKIKI